jgi:hypothetical protein
MLVFSQGIMKPLLVAQFKEVKHIVLLVMDFRIYQFK